MARRTAGAVVALEFGDGGGDLCFIDHHRFLFHPAAAGARVLPSVREGAAGLLGGLLKECGGADDVSPAEMPFVDLAQCPQTKRLVGDRDLGHFPPKALVRILKQIHPPLGQRLAGHLRRVVLGHLGALRVQTELGLYRVGHLLATIPACQGLDDEALMHVGQLCHISSHLLRNWYNQHL